ncbi:hypothetical protein BGZ61DRAFT_460719 [Ilyonectria robusta]|uniref:uncharacterized protein n=1 Tax=Ilyonectria robusta TaxID=1079257 RepID=UPI001E8E6D16|nr:uncharacterized protein BGZ61DRAFT_460719 [Ilyonectria robusta]KAH8669286.1 hypothetical protein BGZ61DRAFT_460719 [Ilyonectria robusta]
MVSAEAILATCVFLVDVPLMLVQFWVFYHHSHSREPLYIWLGCLFVAIGTEATPLGLLWYELESGGEVGLPVGVLAELVILVALWWRILTEGLYYHFHFCAQKALDQWIVRFSCIISLICVSVSLILVMASQLSNARYCLAIGCTINRLSVISVYNSFACQTMKKELPYHRSIHSVIFILSCFFGSPLFDLVHQTSSASFL